MPKVEFSAVVRLLTVDWNFTPAEAKYVTRFADAGLVDRGDLYDSYLDLKGHPAPSKSGLATMENYFESSAEGLERSFYLVDPRLTESISRTGVTTPGALLDKAGAPAKRAELARKAGVDVKEIEALVSQADLQRISGIDKRTARALSEAGIKSVAQLAFLSTSVVRQKLAKRLPANAVPSEAILDRWRATARTLPKKVAFGAGIPGSRLAEWNQIATGDRPLRLYEARGGNDPLLKLGKDVEGVFAATYLRSIGAPQSALDTFQANMPTFVDELVDWQGDYEGGYDRNSKPSIQEFKVDSKHVGTTFSFSAHDGSESMYVHLFYDCLEKKFTASLTGNSANGSADDYWGAL